MNETGIIVPFAPECYDVPILNYSGTEVYCKGYFRYPTEEEIRIHSKKPFAIFQNAEPHGWKISCYSTNEVRELIKYSRPI